MTVNSNDRTTTLLKDLHYRDVSLLCWWDAQWRPPSGLCRASPHACGAPWCRRSCTAPQSLNRCCSSSGSPGWHSLGGPRCCSHTSHPLSSGQERKMKVCVLESCPYLSIQGLFFLETNLISTSTLTLIKFVAQIHIFKYRYTTFLKYIWNLSWCFHKIVTQWHFWQTTLSNVDIIIYVTEMQLLQ